MEDLGKYMTENIRSTMAAAYRNVLGNPREARFVLHMQQSFRRAERKRRALLEQEELAVPPFLTDWHHTGGCTLYEHRDEVEQLCQQSRQQA